MTFYKMAQIGRLSRIGWAKETTKGTPVTVSKLISVSEATFTPLAVKVNDEWSLWVIDDITQQDLAQQRLQIAINGALKPNRTLELFEATLWAVWAVAGSDPYTWTFTIKQDNNHPAYTIYHKDEYTEERATYAMLSDLSISVDAQNHVLYTSNWIARGTLTATTATPTYDLEENFLSRKVTCVIADDVAWLSGGTELKLRTFNITFSKNLLEDFVLGNINAEDIYNQAFWVAGDMELTYRSDDIRDFQFNNTKKAMRITIVGDEEIDTWPAEYNTITITLWSVAFEDWGHSSSNNDIVTQTVGFIKEKGEPTNMEITVKNTRATL
jgi:hypothetical protein